MLHRSWWLFAMLVCVGAMGRDALDGSLMPEGRTQGMALKTELPSARYFEQEVDHFSPNSDTWMQPYFVNDTFYTHSADSPATVFLCVGGEGPPLDGSVVVASPHCNVAVEWLQETGAILFAVEHRYYSCHNMSACPVSDFSQSNALQYLSSKQALADLAGFHAFVTSEYSFPDGTKWVSFGGSYPGMLAGWFRLKYPDLVHAAVASSAPVRAELDMTGYFDVIAESFNATSAGGSPECLDIISTGHKVVGELMNGTAIDKDELAKMFDVQGGGKAFNDLDFQRSFAGYGVVPFPGQGNDPACDAALCNINKVCTFLTSAKGAPLQRLQALYKAMLSVDERFRATVALASSPSSSDLIAATADRSARSHLAEDPWYRQQRLHRRQRQREVLDTPNDEPDFWGYQTCTEFAFYQTCEVGTKCMFTQGLATLPSVMSFCESDFGISVDEVAKNVEQTNAYYGSDKPKGTRIMFPNGEIDPWHANSVLSPLPDEPTLWVIGASHHFWTHPSLPTDSQDVVKARAAIRAQVTDWLKQK